MDLVAQRLGDSSITGPVNAQLDQLRTLVAGLAADQDLATNSALQAIAAELSEKLEPGQEVNLGTATLDALENINVTGPLTNAQLRSAPVQVDVGANLAVTAEFESRVSTLNSTDVPLLANETFTGQWEEVTDYAAIIAAIKTDAASAQDGAIAQFSDDGTNVIHEAKATIPANLSTYFAFPVVARYFRILYTNGPVDQTDLQAQVTFSFNAVQVPLGAVGSVMDDSDVVAQTKSASFGKVMSGPYTGMYLPQRVDETGNLYVVATANDLDIRPLSSATDSIAVPGVSTAANQDTQNALLTDIETGIDSINAKDFATQATLASVLTQLQSIASEDFATQATLANVLTELQSISAEDFATQATLAEVLTELQSIASEDFATQATLANALTQLQSIAGEDFATQTTLAGVLTELQSIASEDFATQATLANVLTQLQSIAGEDFATQTTLASVLTQLQSIASEDFATQTTLANVLTELQSINSELGSQQTDALTDTQLRASQVKVFNEYEEAISAMLNKTPFINHRLWWDTTNASYIYIGMAPTGTASSTASFYIMRIPKVTGGLQGAGQLVANAAWDDRTTVGGWS